MFYSKPNEIDVSSFSVFDPHPNFTKKRWSLPLVALRDSQLDILSKHTTAGIMISNEHIFNSIFKESIEDLLDTSWLTKNINPSIKVCSVFDSEGFKQLGRLDRFCVNYFRDPKDGVNKEVTALELQEWADCFPYEIRSKSLITGQTVVFPQGSRMSYPPKAALIWLLHHLLVTEASERGFYFNKTTEKFDSPWGSIPRPGSYVKSIIELRRSRSSGDFKAVASSFLEEVKLKHMLPYYKTVLELIFKKEYKEYVLHLNYTPTDLLVRFGAHRVIWNSYKEHLEESYTDLCKKNGLLETFLVKKGGMDKTEPSIEG